MAKGLFGGMTDYNHQSFLDILTDLNNEQSRITSFLNVVQANINKVKANSYWDNNVPYDFKNIISYSLKYFNTAISELEDIKNDLNNEVREHHIKRLNKISKVADEINVDIGKVWHQQYHNKNYGNQSFTVVEYIYQDTRDMAVNLLDTENIAERLKDYIGKTKLPTKNNNPWISGSFYLFVAIIAIIGLAVISNSVSWTMFPIIIIGGILIIGIVGVLQLKNDDKITDKSFTSLISETYKRLPLLRHKSKLK